MSERSAGFELRIILTVWALLTIDAYAGSVFWSLFVGAADYIFPVKVTFFTAVLTILLLSIGECRRGMLDWNGAPEHRLGVLTGFGGIVSMLFLLFTGLVILRASSAVDLRGFDLQVRIFVVAGLVAIVGLTIYEIDYLIGLFRRKPLPRISPARPPGANTP